MDSLISELLDCLDQGIGIFELESLCFVEANNTLLSWLGPATDQSFLTDYISTENTKRIQKSIKKGRKFRFSSNVKIKSRRNTIDFNTSVAKFSNGKSYLVLQGVVNNSELELQKMMKDYGVLSKKHSILLNKEKEKAEMANNAKSLFLATMSHEIRTPMNGIMGVAQQMRKTPLNDDQADYLNMIDSSGKQLLAIINEILDFSKLESNKVKLRAVNCDLKVLVNDVVSIYSGGVDKSERLEVKSVFQQNDYPNVLVDDTRLKQVLMNLVNNAVKFTESGFVELSLDLYRQTEDSVELALTVADTGIGIEQENIGSLFEAFTQHDCSTTRRFGGTGLGLSICSQIIELMGGSIEVTSKLGEGSQFKILLALPLSEIQAVDNDENNVTQSSINNLSLAGKKILVAEDTEINREIIKMAFEDSGVELLIAENGEEAVQLFKENVVDTILMDCLMPVMDGFKAVEIIREIESELMSNRVPIVAITASTSDDVKKQCLDSGMDAMMHKPFSFEEILKIVAIYANREKGVGNC